MTRIGGRNVVFAWIVGIVCAAVVVALTVLALPLLTSGALFGPPRADGTDAAGSGPSRAQCRDLYSEALRASLSWEPGSELSVSADAPMTSATALVDALGPEVQYTCTWTADVGTLSTTVARVGTDAGSIAAGALPAQGFSCSTTDARTFCSRTDGELVETIEFGGDVWVSTWQSGWRPERYASRVGEAVFAAD